MNTMRTTGRRWRITRMGVLTAGIAVLALAGSQVWGQPGELAPAKTVRGTVERFTTAPRGEIDGALLQDGTFVHWPPHVGDRVTDVIAKNDRIRVTGRQETGPEGDSRLEAETITNVRSGESVNVDDFPPPDRPRGHKGKPRREPRPAPEARGERGPRPDGPPAARPRPEDRPALTARPENDRVEQRLRALERQLEQMRKEIEHLRRGK